MENSAVSFLNVGRLEGSIIQPAGEGGPVFTWSWGGLLGPAQESPVYQRLPEPQPLTQLLRVRGHCRGQGQGNHQH